METHRASLALGLIFLLLGWVSSAGPLFAEGLTDSGPLLSLEEAIRVALERNRQVDNTRLEAEKVGDQVAAAKKNYLPSFDFQVYQSYLMTDSDYTFQKGVFGEYPGVGPIPSSNVKIPTVTGWDTLMTASVAQPISQIYKIGLGVEALEIGVEMADRKHQVQRRTTVAEVKRQYYGLAQTQCAFEAAHGLCKAMEELEHVVSERVKQRTALDVELIEVKAQRARAEYELLKLQNAFLLGRQQMNQLLGRDLGTAFSVSAVWETGIEPLKDLAEPLRPPYSQPGIEALRLSVRQAELNMEIKRAGYIPDLSLVLSYVSPFNSDFLPRNVVTVGLQPNWDLFDWGRRRWEISECGRALQQARNELHDAETLLSIEVQNHMMKLRETAALVRVSQLTQEAAREKLRVATDRYKLPAALLQDVLQAQAAYAEASAQVHSAILGYLTARAELEKAIGGTP